MPKVRLRQVEWEEGTRVTKRGKDIFKEKIIYLINRYYYNQPIYISYFKYIGCYQRVRKILEELVIEGILIKYKDTRPIYYLKKEVFFQGADKL